MTINLFENPQDTWDWCHAYIGGWYGFKWESNCFGWEIRLGLIEIHRSYPMDHPGEI